MQIYINKSTTQNPVWKLAALKKGTSFEYVSENRLFSGSDGYTLTITFPLKDCPQNQAIFGHVNRADVSAGKVVFDCELRDKGFCKTGCINITEINESEVKTQFLDGRSEQNFDKTLDKIYINELDLGRPWSTSTETAPSSAWGGLDAGNESVALPWVNDATGNIQNCAIWSENAYAWHEETTGLSWQPYLIFITAKICEQIGYSCDLSPWEERDDYKYLIICNTLPFSWYSPEYASALPHWTVEEYFEKLELFLGCEFDFDHRAKSISMAFTRDVLNSKRTINLDNVVDAHSTEIKSDGTHCDYSEAKNIAYKDCQLNMWKYYSCDWYVSPREAYAVGYETLDALLEANRGLSTWNGSNVRGSNLNRILYAADVDAYFVIRTVSRVEDGFMLDGKTKKWIYKCLLTPVNLLGPRIVDDSLDATQVDLEFVPACIDYVDADFGFALYLSFAGYDDGDGSVSVNSNYEPWSDAWYEERNSRFAQTQTAKALASGDSASSTEYYDRIYVAYWNGASSIDEGTIPHPFVENVVIACDWSSASILPFTLRLNGRDSRLNGIAPMIDAGKKATFKFIANSLPDVRSLFLIRGKKYVCEKLTATFTEDGMSRLIKGIFYPVKEG